MAAMQEQNQTPEPTATRDVQIKANNVGRIPPKVLKALATAQLSAEVGKATQKASNDGQLTFNVFTVDEVMRIAKLAFKKANLAIMPIDKWVRPRNEIRSVEFTSVVRYAIICDDECAFCEIETPVFGDPSRELNHRIAGANTYAKKKWYEGILGLVQEDPNMPLEPNGPVHDARGTYLSAEPPETAAPATSPPAPATKSTKPTVASRALKKRELPKPNKPDAQGDMPEKLRPYTYEIYKAADKLSPRVRAIVAEALKADSYATMDNCIGKFQGFLAEISATDADIVKPILAVRKIEIHCATRPPRLLSDWNDLHNRKDQLPKSDFEHLRSRLVSALEESGQTVPAAESVDIYATTGEP
jgi:hypothetical protein